MDAYLHATNTKLGVFRDVIIEEDYNPLDAKSNTIRIPTGNKVMRKYGEVWEHASRSGRGCDFKAWIGGRDSGRDGRRGFWHG
jgi:hypothetical protein